jgi:hypothetical protein
MAKVLGGSKRSRETNDSADSFGKKTESMRKAKEYESGCFSMLSTYQPFYEKLKTAGLAANEDKFIRCTVELSRYLAIKAMRNDIIASPRIQQVLHELLLFPQFYYNVCRKLLPGNDRGVIDNNPLLTNTPGQYQVVIDLYKSYFGPPDPEYWPIASSNGTKEIRVSVSYSAGGGLLSFNVKVTANKTIVSLHKHVINSLVNAGHIAAADSKFIQFTFPNKSTWTTNIRSYEKDRVKEAADFTFADYNVDNYSKIVAENVRKKVINLVLTDQMEHVSIVPVTMSTQLKEVFQAYFIKSGLKEILDLRFFFEGIRLIPELTPYDYDMVDGDDIRVMLAASGC